MIRYLDFNDSFLAKGEACHPSDNLGSILAAGEWAGSMGRELMTALAVAYQIQCRLTEIAPVRARGFDHTVQGAYAAAGGISKVLRLNAVQSANAIAISGTAFNALRVTRTGRLSHWKGLAYPNLAACCTRVALLARQGITGPLEVIEGEKGLMDAITGYLTCPGRAKISHMCGGRQSRSITPRFTRRPRLKLSCRCAANIIFHLRTLSE